MVSVRSVVAPLARVRRRGITATSGAPTSQTRANSWRNETRFAATSSGNAVNEQCGKISEARLNHFRDLELCRNSRRGRNYEQLKFLCAELVVEHLEACHRGAHRWQSTA
jgi:hypothetical protein